MENLKKYRKQKGLSQADVAQLLGIAQNSYSRYENGSRQPDIEMLQKLASLYGCTVDDLLSDKPQESFGRPIVIKPEPEYEAVVSLPIVASLRCGFGHAGEPYYVIGHKNVPISYVKKWGQNLVLSEAVGDSMSPTIRPHDLMVCCPGDWWEDGMVVVVNVNDSDTVKRIYQSEDGGIDLVPDNPAYKSVHYTPEDITDLQIVVLAHVLTIVPPDIMPVPRRKD